MLCSSYAFIYQDIIFLLHNGVTDIGRQKVKDGEHTQHYIVSFIDSQ